MGLKLGSWGSVLTYAIFTVFPIIMFSIILGKSYLNVTVQCFNSFLYNENSANYFVSDAIKLILPTDPIPPALATNMLILLCKALYIPYIHFLHTF